MGCCVRPAIIYIRTRYINWNKANSGLEKEEAAGTLMPCRFQYFIDKRWVDQPALGYKIAIQESPVFRHCVGSKRVNHRSGHSELNERFRSIDNVNILTCKWILNVTSTSVKYFYAFSSSHSFHYRLTYMEETIIEYFPIFIVFSI